MTGPSGAQVVIPAGALSASTPIAITQTSTGAPALPTGVVAFGPMFAFTPHGTKFNAPVSITVPFDPTLVPAGTQPVLYKTNPAMTGWAAVPNATVSGGTITGSVTSFSDVVAGPPPPPPLEKGTPRKTFTVLDIQLNGSFVKQPHDSGDQDGGVLERNYDFGPGTMTDPGVPLDLLPREFRSTGRIFSSAGGGIYAVSAEAPIAKKAVELAGNDSDYSQSQSYRKRDATARLRLEITQARLEAYDDADPLPLPCNAAQADAGFPKCGGEMLASVDFRVRAHSRNRPNLFRGKGALMLSGWRGHWQDHVNIGLLGSVPLWDETDVDFAPDIDGEDGRHARQSLKKPVFVNIDLSDVGVGEEFTVDVNVIAYTFDGRSHGEFSYLGAFFRDPTRIDGDPQLIAEGLDPTDNPEPPPPSDDPSLPPECLTQLPSGQLDFFSPTYSVLEGGAAVDLLVLRTDGRAGEVSTTVTTSDGTATAPDDYQSVQTVVTFPDGDTAPRFVHVPLVYSAAAEGDKTFTVTLGQPTGCATLGQATSVVTILDDTRLPLPTETFALGGTVTGLVGSGLVLSELFSEQTVSPGADGPFSFANRILDRSPYDVRIQAQPDHPPQACTLDHGSGTFSGADVTNITVTCAPATSSNGLDPSFGTGGRAVTNVPFVAALLGARVGMALQSDGKILLVGGLKLLRLNIDGTLDGSFGTAGVANVVFENGDLDTAMDVAVQADGKIVVAGTTSRAVAVGSDDFALTRFDTRGVLDTTFGTGGHVRTDFFGSTDQVRRIKLQPDGKILVVGRAVHPITPITGSVLFAIARYNADGTPDLGFAVGGKTTDSPGNVFSTANGLAIQTDGKIVVAGFTAASGGDADDTGFVRYLGDGQVQLPGTRDETFGPMSNGVLQASLGGDDEAVDVVILADGTILAAVRVNTGTGPGFGLEHVPATGIPPPRVAQPIVSFTTQSDFPRAMLKQSDGKIVVVGQSAAQAPNPDMAIARFDASGFAPDATFGTDGKLIVDFFGKIDSAEAVVQQADGKLVVGGFARNGSTTVFAAVRLAP